LFFSPSFTFPFTTHKKLMARSFTLGLIGFIALSAAISMVHAHDEQKPFSAENSDNAPADNSAFQLVDFKVCIQPLNSHIVLSSLQRTSTRHFSV
jgi:hypothetical protein